MRGCPPLPRDQPGFDRPFGVGTWFGGSPGLRDQGRERVSALSLFLCLAGEGCIREVRETSLPPSGSIHTCRGCRGRSLLKYPLSTRPCPFLFLLQLAINQPLPLTGPSREALSLCPAASLGGGLAGNASATGAGALDTIPSLKHPRSVSCS